LRPKRRPQHNLTLTKERQLGATSCYAGRETDRKYAEENLEEVRAKSCAGRALMQIPETHYARVGDLRIAYQKWGEGPPLMIVPALISNVDV
jgi:hypothetical protein